MTRLHSALRWRHLRWVALAAVIPALWACNARRLKEPNAPPKGVEKNVFVQSIVRDIDLLFMIDNSSSMRPMQDLLTNNLGAFMTVLENLDGGLPNLHVAVISSSMGAGIWADVPGCSPDVTYQNDDGRFHSVGVNPPGCAGPMGNYIIADGAGNNNFTGQLTDVFSCIAAIGQSGCGFEHQFRSVEAALDRALANDEINGGFLRPDAYLGIIMLTNEDDCSVPWNSMLLDPSQSHVSDPLGGLQTGYRCNEFGHMCNGMRPPHTVTGDTPLTGCTSAEGQGDLVSVSSFVEFVRGTKADPDNQIFVAAIAAPVTPYIVELRPGVMTTDGGLEDQPAIAHSCGPRMVPSGSMTVFGDPGVRISEWVDAFGDHGVYENICNQDFAGAMRRIAEELSRVIGPQCLRGTPTTVEDATVAWATGSPNTPDCQVALRRRTPNGTMEDPVDYCTAAALGAASMDNPCWRIVQGMNNCLELQVCYTPTCTADRPPDALNAQVACSLFLPPG